MTKEGYLSDHDENVKGGVLWWVVFIIILVLISVFT